MRLLIPLALAALLAACLPFGGRDDAPAHTGGMTPSPLAAEAVRVTSLDAPATTPAASAGATARPSATPSATPAVTAPQPRPDATAAAEGASDPQATATPAAAADAPAATPQDAPPPAPKSAAQLACEGDGGTWARAGGSVAMTCFRPTRDGGQSCRRESDCSTLCLARSRSCAPLTPLFGCHEVLQDNGSAVTLCLD
ncbi:MAG: hypothetical protein RIR62_1576 [Pseudomonadota bacterium]